MSRKRALVIIYDMANGDATEIPTREQHAALDIVLAMIQHTATGPYWEMPYWV